MKHKFGVLLVIVWVHISCLAQEPIYRCGNEYTNAKPVGARARDCSLVAGTTVTVVPGTRVPKPAAAPVNAGTQRPDSAEQRAREADARLILQAELKKAQARQDDLQKQYNAGAPEKLASETHNHQKYLDRVAELKASLSRNESDIAGIRRELDRLPGGAAPQAAR